MSLGVCLQVVGGGLEALSVVVLAIGITKTRAAFLDEPAWIVRSFNVLVRPLRRLFRRPVVIQARGAAVLTAAGEVSARGIVIPDWSRLSPEESIQRLQQIADRHEEEISHLLGRVRKEERERRAAQTEEQRERESQSESLGRRITEAATGGLRYETWGATFLALGIGVTVAGRWIG
jgi:hypothetical protein